MPTTSPSIPSSTTLALLLLTTVFAADGCDFQRTVDLEPPSHEPRLTVNGEIQPGSPWRLDVSRSVGAFEPGPPSDTTFTVTDATVTVFEEGERQGQLPLDSLNQYSTRKFLPEPGRQYTVRVIAPDLDTVEATDRVPRMPATQLQGGASETTDSPYDRTLEITINDPADTDNYYHLRFQKKGYQRDSTSIDTLGLTDVWFQTRDRSIVDEMKQVLEEANRYRGREAMFRDVLFGGNRHTIRLHVDEGTLPLTDQENGDGYPRIEYVVYMSALSENAYQFDHTKRIFERTEDNPFAEPVDVHSNVEGGYGIVGGRHTDTLTVTVQPDF